MRLHELSFTEGSRPEKHRKGRGHAAGKGKQAGKGQSGQNKRSGHRLGFEGGQTPWFRRIGKRGFTNVNHIEFQVVNLSQLQNSYQANEEVTIESLFAKGLVKRTLPIKVLGNGAESFNKPLVVRVHKISEVAEAAILKAGGKVEAL
ncbi:50S ribosomal protein L15 [Mycoplasma corogypsi]|uniref:50S ribosomal protein L15 n=1 Tax=Mycoplasma corogypsi TaxID=2106 RepID=UPI003872BA68